MPLIILPVLLLLLVGILLLGIYRIKPDFGYFWIGSVLAGLVAWGGLLALRWQTPLFFSMNLWQDIGFQVGFPLLQLDPYSWPYAFSVSALILAVVLTGPVRISQGSNPVSWAMALLIGGLSLLGILAANPLTLIIAWSMMDLIELAYSLKNAGDATSSRNIVISFSIGLAGTFLAVWAMLVSQADGLALSFTSMTPSSSQFLVLAAGLRLAVFPIMVVFRQDTLRRRGLASLLKLAAPCTSLVMLARMPAVAVSPALSPLLFSLAIIALLYGAVRWFTALDEIAGRPYWILALTAMALICLLQGRPDVSPAWGAAMVLGGGLLSLYSARQVRLLFIPLIAFLALTGIIFTPTSPGWAGLWIEPFQAANILFLIGHSLILAGFLRHVFRQDDEQEEIDRWVQVIYPAGLIILVITFILTGFWSVQQYGLQLFWLGPVLSTALALGWLALRSWLEKDKPLQSTLKSVGGLIGNAFSYIIHLTWFYGVVNFLFQVLRQFVFWFTNTLEGDGGVLWALLVLLLLITLIRPEVLP
jgi:hypothetical protein